MSSLIKLHPCLLGYLQLYGPVSLVPQEHVAPIGGRDDPARLGMVHGRRHIRRSRQQKRARTTEQSVCLLQVLVTGFGGI